MGRGGSRNKSGPGADPNSGRSEQRGIVLTALPSEGRQGRVPAFPLPKIVRWKFEDGKRVPDKTGSTSFRRREMDVWRAHWKMPQACAWELEPWRWPTIAEFCRLKTVVEMEPDANASLVAQLHRFRDQIGLTPAGLRENGWAIARNQVGEQAAKKAAAKPAAKKAAPARRLRSIDGGA
jgi:hypothetical protein